MATTGGYSKWASAAHPIPPTTTTAASRTQISTSASCLRAEPGIACSPGPELPDRLVALSCGLSDLLIWAGTGDRGHCRSWAAPCVPGNGVSHEATGVTGSAGATTRTWAVAASGVKTLRCWGGGAMTDLVPGGDGCSAGRFGERDDERRAFAGGPAAFAGGPAAFAGAPTDFAGARTAFAGAPADFAGADGADGSGTWGAGGASVTGTGCVVDAAAEAGCSATGLAGGTGCSSSLTSDLTSAAGAGADGSTSVAGSGKR